MDDILSTREDFISANIIWGIKQLLPLKYKSKYHNTKENVTWRMWFGKCFNIKTTPMNKKENK